MSEDRKWDVNQATLADLRDWLDGGWEPFAVTQHEDKFGLLVWTYHLRKEREPTS